MTIGVAARREHGDVRGAVVRLDVELAIQEAVAPDLGLRLIEVLELVVSTGPAVQHLTAATLVSSKPLYRDGGRPAAGVHLAEVGARLRSDHRILAGDKRVLRADPLDDVVLARPGAQVRGLVGVRAVELIEHDGDAAVAVAPDDAALRVLIPSERPRAAHVLHHDTIPALVAESVRSELAGLEVGDLRRPGAVAARLGAAVILRELGLEEARRREGVVRRAAALADEVSRRPRAASRAATATAAAPAAGDRAPARPRTRRRWRGGRR